MPTTSPPGLSDPPQHAGAPVHSLPPACPAAEGRAGKQSLHPTTPMAIPVRQLSQSQLAPTPASTPTAAAPRPVIPPFATGPPAANAVDMSHAVGPSPLSSSSSAAHAAAQVWGRPRCKGGWPGARSLHAGWVGRPAGLSVLHQGGCPQILNHSLGAVHLQTHELNAPGMLPCNEG